VAVIVMMMVAPDCECANHCEEPR